ncbi:MAG: hypothetical protein NTX69_01850 [Candidatus Bipolaricaulota bacterium]|nr:hypothetical protein [Candidatus Bipolaricaulota bacterium]
MSGSGRRKRWTWIVLGTLASLGLLLLAFVLVLHFTVPAPHGDEVQMIAVRAIPPDWVEVPAVQHAPEESATPFARATWQSTGALALTADGRSFGEETYELSVSADGAVLKSSGRFWFKMLLATIDVPFQQRWEGGADLEPMLYTLRMDAPFGQGQDVAGALDGDRFAVRRNRVETSVSIAPERAIILGTFSTYALVPLLFEERQQDGVASLDVLLFGGPPGAAAAADGGGLPTIVVERAGTATARTGDLLIEFDVYRIRSPFGDSVLYAKGREFLALVAGTPDQPLLVYRSDYFPQGLSVVGSSE